MDKNFVIIQNKRYDLRRIISYEALEKTSILLPRLYIDYLITKENHSVITIEFKSDEERDAALQLLDSHLLRRVYT